MIELDTTQPTPKHEITELRMQLSGGNASHNLEGDSVYIPLFVKHSKPQPRKFSIVLIRVRKGVYIARVRKPKAPR